MAQAQPKAPALKDECPCRLRWTNASNEPIAVDAAATGPRILAVGQTAGLCRPAGETTYLVDAGTWRYTAAAQCLVDETRTVIVRSPGGSLQVHNDTGEPQNFAVDNGTAASIAAGSAKIFGPLTVGRHALTARSQHSAQAWAGTAVIVAGRQMGVHLPKPKGKLKLVNPLAELTALLVDGRPFGQVGAHAEVWITAVGPGGHAVRWQGVDSGKIRDEVWLADDSSARRSGSLTLDVSNLTGEDIELPPELAHLGGVLPTKARTKWSLVRGDYRLHGTGRESGLDYWFDVRNVSAQQQKWRIKRPTAMLRVVNRGGETAVVLIHGANVATLRDKGVGVFRVPAGSLQLRAERMGRSEVQTAGVFLQPHDQALWTIAARDTHVVVKNEWPEVLDVRVDGRRAAQVAAGGDVRLPLKAGQHELQVWQHRLGWHETSQLQIKDGERLRAIFGPPSAAVALDNRAGTQAATLTTDGIQVQAPAGKRAVLPVPAGAVHLTTATVDGERSERSQLVAAPTQQFTLPPPARRQIQLTIIAAPDRGAVVQIDDGPARTLAAGEQWVVGQVQAREHLVIIQDGSRQVRAALKIDGRKAKVHVQLKRADAR
ncbi:MAG: hypothetical protein EXR77_17190 [Myxococcales bacterium]|nr:hypothetical protein [Myxococcales bacterium]